MASIDSILRPARETVHDDGRLRAGHGRRGVPGSDRCAVVRDVERPRPTRTRAGCPLATSASDPDHRVARHWYRASCRHWGNPSSRSATWRRSRISYRSTSWASASGPVKSCAISTCWRGPTRTGAPQTSTARSRTPALHRVDIDSVRAVNSDGIVSAHPAAIDFTILSPLWLRWWALALIATTAGALLRGYRARVARLLELVHIRTRIATDLHDDVGANLTRIAVLAEVASHTTTGHWPRSRVSPANRSAR